MMEVVDTFLLSTFEKEIKSRVPHPDPIYNKIMNPSPLIDITRSLLDCAKIEYGMNISQEGVNVLGKLESVLLGGSVKTRAAVKIIEDAIKAGRLRHGQTIFEATSGNFGLALGMISKLGLDVVALVSRKLQDGVLNELRLAGVKIIDLDVEICPAPGLQLEMNSFTASLAFDHLRSELSRYNYDTSILDTYKPDIERLLAKQDVINLAKLMAHIYDGFCPEQYENELNVTTHYETTTRELDEQLREIGKDLSEYEIICTFGTGGTSLGISRYIKDKYNRKSVHVIFPLEGQDVAGIRTKSKAVGLPFYKPDEYAGEYEFDFTQAKRLLRFFVRNGYDIGESSALSLYAVLQLLDRGFAKKFIVILPDGIKKYSSNLYQEKEDMFEVTKEEVISNSHSYGTVIWAHAIFTPKSDYLYKILSILGLKDSKVIVLKPSDVKKMLDFQDIPESLLKEVNHDTRNTLVICVAGSNSLSVAKQLTLKGVKAHSLSGGVAGLTNYDSRLLSDMLEAFPN